MHAIKVIAIFAVGYYLGKYVERAGCLEEQLKEQKTDISENDDELQEEKENSEPSRNGVYISFTEGGFRINPNKKFGIFRRKRR